MFFIFLGNFFFTSDVLAAWYDSQYAHRKSHLITGATNAGTNYQVKIIAYKATGTDTDGTVYLGTGVQDDFDDVRFTDNDETTPLDFWIASTTPGVSAEFWVEVVDTLDSNATIYVYYENPSATSASNGPNTFLFFDDFSGDLSKWTIDAENTDKINIVSGALRHDPDSSQTKNVYFDTRAYVTTLALTDFSLNYKTYLAGATNRKIHQMGWRTDGLTFNSGYAWRNQNSATDGGFFEFAAGAWTPIGTAYAAVAADTWLKMEVKAVGSAMETFINGSSVKTVTDATTSGGSLTTHVHGINLGASDYVLIDDVYVRKLVATEPAHSTWGAEESNSTPGRYWVGGAVGCDGTWADIDCWASTSNGAGGASVPTSADDVFFDANSGSGTATIGATANTKNLDFTSFVGVLSGSSQINIFGNLVAGAGMTWTHSGTITFSTTTGTQTIKSNGVQISGTIAFNGVGGTFKLLDTLTLKGANRGITLTNGTFDPNGQTVVMAPSTSNGIQPISGEFSFYNLTLAPVNIGQIITIGSNITVTNNLVINGVSSTNRAFISSNTLGTPRTITAANVSVTNTDFRDITGAGAGSWNLSAISGGSGDAGGNSGITFTTADTMYWTGNTGNWSDATQWCTTSGGCTDGAGDGRVPLPQDDVVFDNGSFNGTSQTATLDMPRAGKNITWTGVLNTPAFRITQNTSIFGSFVLTTGMTFPSVTATLTFEGRGPFNLDSAGLEFTSYQVALSAPGGTLTLQDDLTLGVSKGLTINNGSFDANNYNYTGGYFNSSNSNVRSISLGSGTFTILSESLNNQWFISTIANLSFNAGASTIVMASTNSSTVKNFYGGGLTYNNLEITTSNVVIVGSNTFNKLSLNNAGQAIGTRFTNGTTQTVTSFETNGSAGNLVYASSTSASATATLTKAGGGTICEDYMHLTWMTGSPADTWYVGANSTNGGNNSGMNFSSCGIMVSGVAYESEGGAVATSKAIKVYNNGTTLIGSATSNASTGAWSATLSPAPSSGDILTVYIDNDAIDANVVFVSDGTAQSNINLYGNALIVRKDTTGGSITNANLFTGAIYGEDDMIYATSSTANITLDSNANLHVYTGDTYSAEGTLTTQGTGDLRVATSSIAFLNTTGNTIAGDIVAYDSSLVYINANTTVNGGDIKTQGTSNTGNFLYSKGAYTPTVTISGTGVIQDGNASSTFYALTISGTGTITGGTALAADNALTVESGGSLVRSNGTFTMANGSTISNSGTLTFYGLIIESGGTVTANTDFSIANALTIGSTATLNPSSGTITMLNGSTITNSGTLLSFNNLTIPASATITANTDYTVKGTLSLGSSANLSPSSGTVIMANGSTISNSGTLSFYNLTIPDSATVTTASSFSISGALSVGAGANLSPSAGTITMTGGSITNSGTLAFKNLAIAGNVTTASTFSVVGDMTSTSGTLTTSGGTITVTGDLSVGGTITGTGSITVNGGDTSGNGTLNLTSGVFTLDGIGLFGSNTNWTFNELKFGDGSGVATTTSIGTGTITTATTTISANQILDAGVSKTWNLTASFEPLQLSGTLLASTSSFVYQGTANATVTPATYYNLEIAPTSGSPTYLMGTTTGQTITVGNNLTIGGTGNATLDLNTKDPDLSISGNLTIGSGDTFSASDSGALTISGNFSNNGTFTHNSGTITFSPTSVSTVSSLADITFNNLSFTSAGKTLKFQSHSANVPKFTITGTLTSTGESQSNPVYIESTTPGTQWLVYFNTEQASITHTSFKDSGCFAGSASVTSSPNYNRGNNDDCWGLGQVQGPIYGVSWGFTEIGSGGGVFRDGGALTADVEAIDSSGSGGEEQTGGEPTAEVPASP